MVDLSFRKFRGIELCGRYARASRGGPVVPAGAQAATGVPGVPSAVTALPDVPATAQAAVGAALAQAGGGDVDRARSRRSRPPYRVCLRPRPRPPRRRLHRLLRRLRRRPSRSRSRTSTSPRRLRRQALCRFPKRSPWWRAELVWRFPPPGRTRPRRRRGSHGRRQRQRCAPSATVRPPWSGQRCASKLGHGEPLVAARPIELVGAVRAPAAGAGWPRLARGRRVASPPVVVVAPHRAHKRFANATAASTAAAATAVEPISPSTPASLPPGGAGGAGAGAGAGPAGAAAVALLVLAGVALLRSILPGLMSARPLALEVGGPGVATRAPWLAAAGSPRILAVRQTARRSS